MPKTLSSRNKVGLFASAIAFLLVALAWYPVLGRSRSSIRPAAPRPNVVLILADDLGYSDIGAFGGEIDTPNLDALARRGLILTDFHAAPTCSPTRSMLMSGTDNHSAGVGAMAEVPMDHGRWGYEGHLVPRVATIAERLKAAGYHTAMAGKWHLGMTPDDDPHARGFERSFALLQGAHNHFGKGGFGPSTNPLVAATYTRDGVVTTIPDDFYSSDYFTGQLIDELRRLPGDKPFFAYLAFTAPHSPLQAPADVIARYHGRYDAGWAALRDQRLARMKALGIVPADIAPAPMVPDAHAWEKLSPQQRAAEARKMEIYAAMVDRLDKNVGRLIADLKRTGRYANTIFLFSSDNGPAGETGQQFSMMDGVVPYIERADNSLASMGSARSFVFYGPYWAQASSAPARLYKGVMTEGGTHVPAFITYPGFGRQKAVGRVFADVMDILPTILDATGSPALPTMDGRPVEAISGRSMLPYLLARSDAVHESDEPISFELHGQRAVRQGSWKLLSLPKPFGNGDWALYDLASDPAEQTDVSDLHPERKHAMIAAWEEFARRARIGAFP